MPMALHLYWVGFGVLTVWMAILFVTPLWECVLYGVQERELEGLVRAAMRVSRVPPAAGPAAGAGGVAEKSLGALEGRGECRIGQSGPTGEKLTERGIGI